MIFTHQISILDSYYNFDITSKCLSFRYWCWLVIHLGSPNITMLDWVVIHILFNREAKGNYIKNCEAIWGRVQSNGGIVSISTNAKGMTRANRMGRWSIVPSICKIIVTSFNSQAKLCKFMRPYEVGSSEMVKTSKLCHYIATWRACEELTQQVDWAWIHL